MKKVLTFLAAFAAVVFGLYASLWVAAQTSTSADMYGVHVLGSDGRNEDRDVTAIAVQVRDFWEAHPEVSAAEPGWQVHERGVTCGARWLGWRAGYCASNQTVFWDRSAMREVRERFGDPGVMVVIAHEVGHHIAPQFGVEYIPDAYLPAELAADCLAGVFAGSQNMSAEQVAQAHAALEDIGEKKNPNRDSLDRHGTADERVAAWQEGFERGVAACVSQD